MVSRAKRWFDDGYPARGACCVLILVFNGPALAGDWEFTPRLTLGEIFTDNVDQEPSDEKESDLVTEVSPGFSANRQGGRLQASIDYSLQALHSVRDNEIDINHRLFGLSTAEILENQLFFDATASITQVLISAEETDDVLLGNRSDVITYGLSPYWINDFRGYAETAARYSYDVVLIEEGASDTEAHTVTLDLDSGRRFTSLFLNMNYVFQQLNREDEENERRQRAIGLFGYRLIDDLSFLARAGYEKNDVPTAEDVEDGFFWSLGANWNPSRFIDATVLYGPDDKEFSLRSSPSRRTTVEFGYLDRDVGVNPESTWFGALTHRTRHSTWSARYTEGTTNVQRLFIDQPLGVDDDTIFDDQGQVIIPQDSLSLTDEEFFRKRFDASVAYTRGRTGLTVGAFFEDREFDDSSDNERAFGADAAVSRRIAPRTSGLVGIDWQRTELREGGDEEDTWDFGLRVTHTFTPEMDGFVEYRHILRDSTDPEEDFHENRISLFLTMVF